MPQSQPNNQAARKGKSFKDALIYALKNYEDNEVERKQALKKVAHSLVKKAIEGELPAINMIADRLDGKPAQAITGPSGEPITLVERVIVVQAIDNQEKEAIPGEIVPDLIEQDS